MQQVGCASPMRSGEQATRAPLREVLNPDGDPQPGRKRGSAPHPHQIPHAPFQVKVLSNAGPWLGKALPPEPCLLLVSVSNFPSLSVVQTCATVKEPGKTEWRLRGEIPACDPEHLLICSSHPHRLETSSGLREGTHQMTLPRPLGARVTSLPS